jgi:phosphopantetheine adenylyltransferase
MAPAPHGKVLWLTHPDQIIQLEDFIVPILKGLIENSLNIIIRLEGEERFSVRFKYGVLFAVYQKVTLLSSKLDPKLTANLDLRVYLEHLCDIKMVTDNFKASIDFIVYENISIKDVHKDHVRFLHVQRDFGRVFVPESPLLVSIPDEKLFNSVALGGTFDHLHSGHKLMLSLAILITRDRILCGITASEMLTNKNHPEKLESLENRMLTVQEFFKEFKAGSEGKIEIVTLRDPFGPTIELDDLEALVVSPETLAGGLRSKIIF